MAMIKDNQMDHIKTLSESINEVEQIRKGKLPKRSYKDMMNRVRENLKEGE
ncbi:hypothetical protein [Sporosarcina obsidiansis]|uniref:hypothetical protein n=1 Tax=Sporosarcina obsidiansis TaxID=2660748 RepID=UPI00129AD2D8|nr:hypothetical protein [Sporosarcina obsidiansis]